MKKALLYCFVALWCSQATTGRPDDKLKKTHVVTLTEENWRSMLDNEWMVEFYAPWCPACKSLSPTWEEFASWSDDLSIRTAKIDVTDSPGLSGRFFVTALPTIFHVLNGEFRQYRGSRDLNSLMSFIEEKKWQQLEKISALKSPDSIQMSVISYFFKLSHTLKELNNQMLREYGLPAWASYAIFAIVTILLGAMLGLVFVCCIDFIFPQKKHEEYLVREDEFEDDIRGDELEDENAEQEKSGGEDNDEEEDDDDEDEDEDDREKYSGSDSDDESKKSPPPSPAAGGKGGADVRKRKPRKAD